MRTRTPKMISLALVLVMLVTMIPAGIFSANAAEASAELVAGLADYANTPEFVINSVEDWEYLATYATDNKHYFVEKTVKLGADIDANGEALPLLFARFEGTFDGQNYTIKNVTNVATQEALIAKTVNDNATIKNVKLDKINMALLTASSAGSGLLIGTNIATTTTSVTVQNISVTNSTVTAKSQSVGAVIGVLFNTGPVEISDITLDNVQIVGSASAALIWAGSWGALNGITVRNIKATNSSVTGKSGASGMFLGIGTNVAGTTVLFENMIADVDVTVNTAASAQASLFMASAIQYGANQTWNFRNIKVVGTYTDQLSGAGNVGGMFGKIKIKAGGNLNVENCYVGGKISTKGIEEIKDANDVVTRKAVAGPTIGGLAGYQEMTEASPKVTVNNFMNTLYYDSLIRGRAILVAGGVSNTSSSPVFNYTNVTTTNKIDSNDKTTIGVARYYFIWNQSITVNGTSVSGEISQISGGARTDILTVSADKAESMVRYDKATGYIKFIEDHINAEAIQYSVVSDGKYAIRFVALSQLATASDVNMVVIANVKDADGNVIKRLRFNSAKVGTLKLYDALTVYDKMGIAERIIAEQYGAEKLAGVTIYNIPVGNAITFEVTTSYADNYGKTLQGINVFIVNFDANGALVNG